MADRLVLAPDYLLPDYLGPDGGADERGVGYSEGRIPDADVLDRVGFFVPAYIEHPNAEWMAKMPLLEVVQLPTVGFDSVLAHLPAGVTLCNAAGVHEQSTAELTVGLIITRWRGLDRSARDMPAGTWDHRRGRSLQEAQVLVIGTGGVGTAIASSLEPFGCRIQKVARTRRDDIAGREELPGLLPTADVVIVAVPLTGETLGLVDDQFLSAMQDGALLVNVARGQVAVTADVLAHTGRLEFALDVTDPEPLPQDHPLWSAPGVFISPHIGGDTDSFPRLARRLIGHQVQRWRTGEQLVNVVGVG